MISQLTINQFKEWDNYVKNHPNGTVFHTSSWLMAQKGELRILAGYEKNKIIGGCAFIIKNRFGVKGIHNVPYTPFRGVLYGDISLPTNKNSIGKKNKFIKNLLKTINYGHVEFLLNTNDIDVLPYTWAGYTVQRINTFCINNITTDVLKLMSSNKKREISKFQKALKSGEFEIGSNNVEEEIFKLQLETGKRNNFDTHLQTLKEVLKSNKSNYFSICLKSEKLGVFSGGIFVFDDKRIYNLINGSQRVDHPVFKNANVYLIYLAIEKAREMNLTFDFEGSSIEGIGNFYKMMGGEQQIRYRVLKSKNPLYFMLRSLKQWKIERK